ncbi:ABC transporter substrate-binding protein [Streptomyces phytophilus]|uniref:ABC transporter substrate-binding protein n=1 Tax=Streptomyces phytophilus TaxID=722715 RepID=UPI00215DBB88|nr:ABC transporter substrate-binding protein [Streptomyces phytophilus]
MALVRRRPLGRAEKAILAVLALAAITAGAVLLVLRLGGGDPCGDGLAETANGQECVGVADATAESPAFEPGADGPDERIADLVRKVAEENRRVQDLWEGQEGPNRKPYVQVALMLPFNSSKSSAMTPEVVEHSLAGVLTAQIHANENSGVNYQLLLTNIGRHLSEWEPAVDTLARLTTAKEPVDEDTPLVGAVGLPNSEQDTQDLADALSAADVPVVSGVLSSPEISADKLFKSAPSNRESVAALAGYLDERPGAKSGYLVWDMREEDNYVTNTRENMRDVFGEQYRLENRNSSFIGSQGDDYRGAPQRFSPAARGICRLEADTVFYAGRDSDLPHLITQLSAEAECDDFDAEIRILRVATGLPDGLMGEQVHEDMAEARVVTVGASATDAPSWRAGDGSGERFATFAKGFAEVSGLPGEALNDGYAIMHHDAFLVVTRATETALDDMPSSDEGEAERLPSPLDVYNTITNMKVVAGADSCQDCISGASGQFGFDVEKDNWPVCKPVPIIEYPRPEGADRPRLYRTFQGPDGRCPA